MKLGVRYTEYLAAKIFIMFTQQGRPPYPGKGFGKLKSRGVVVICLTGVRMLYLTEIIVIFELDIFSQVSGIGNDTGANPVFL